MSGSTGQMIARLVESAKEGDRSAFDVLFELYRAKLISFISRRFISLVDEAEDIVTEAFGRGWAAMPKFRGDCAFDSWLATIAINIARNRATSAPATREVSYNAPIESGEGKFQGETADEQTPLPESELQTEEMQKLVQKAIARLRLDYREVIMLRDFDGLSYEEIATRLNITEQATKSRLFRARQSLKELLSRDDYFLEYAQSGSRLERNEERRKLIEKVEGHRRDIKGLVMRLIGDGAQIGMTPDDVVQEVLIRVWRSLDQYTEQGQLLAWLLTITRNTVINFVRKGKKQIDHVADTVSADDPEVLHGSDVPDEARPFDDLLAGVGAAEELLALLPDEFRETCRLSDVGGLEYKEVAEALGIPLGTVRSRLFRGRKLLRELLTEKEEEALALRPTGRRRKGAGPSKTALDPAATIKTLRREVRGALENATWNNGYKGVAIDPLVNETYRRAEAWVGVFKGQGRVRFLQGWILNIAKLVAKLAIDEIKRSCSDADDLAELVEGDLGHSAQTSQSLDDLLSAREDITALLDQMPEDVRTAYGLKVVCGSTNKQIIEAIGGTDLNVRSVLSMARETLTKILGSKEAYRQASVSNQRCSDQTGGEAVGKARGPAIIASKLAHQVDGLPLRPYMWETLYQNLARTCEVGSEDDLAKWAARFGADCVDDLFKRFCHHRHTSDDLKHLSAIDPNLPARNIAGIAWLECEVGGLTVYELEERLSKSKEEGAGKKLEEFYHLLGCSDGEEYIGRLDMEKLPGSAPPVPTDEAQAFPAETDPTTTTPEGGDVELALIKRRGDRPASELWPALKAAGFEIEPDAEEKIRDYEADLDAEDRKKFYKLLDLRDEDAYEAWADTRDPNWVPPGAQAKPSGGAQQVTCEEPGEGPFTALEQFVGRILSDAGLVRMADTCITLWGYEHEITFAALAIRDYHKSQREHDGKGLPGLKYMLEDRPKLKGRLPANLDITLLQKIMQIEVDRRRAKREEEEAGEGKGTDTTAASGGTAAPTGASPASGGTEDKKETNATMDNPYAGQKLQGPAMAEFYRAPAAILKEGAKGTVREFIKAIVDEAGTGNGAKVLNDFLANYEKKLPLGLTVGGLKQAIKTKPAGEGEGKGKAGEAAGNGFPWSKTSSEGFEGGSADLMLDDFLAGIWDDLDTPGRKKLYEQLIKKYPGCVKDYATFGVTVRRFKANGKGKKAEGAGDDKAAKKAAEKKARQQKVAEAFERDMLDCPELIELIHEDWPTAMAGNQVKTYLAQLKGAEADPDEVYEFVAKGFDLDGHSLEIAEAYKEIEPIVPDPAASAAELKAARQTLVNELCGKPVSDYPLESCIPSDWPAPASLEEPVSEYIARLKGAGIASDIVATFIADAIGHADHALEVVALYDATEPIVPAPAPQPAPQPAPGTVAPSGAPLPVLASPPTKVGYGESMLAVMESMIAVRRHPDVLLNFLGEQSKEFVGAVVAEPAILRDYLFGNLEFAVELRDFFREELAKQAAEAVSAEAGEVQSA